MIKKRVSICGRKQTIEVPEDYKRIFKGPIKLGDLFYVPEKVTGSLIKSEDGLMSCVEDGWECVFRKNEDIPEVEVMPKTIKTY